MRFDVSNHGQLRLAMQLDVAFEGLSMAAFVIQPGGFFTVVSHLELADASFYFPGAEIFPLSVSSTADIALEALKWLHKLDSPTWLQLGGSQFRQTDLRVDEGWWRLVLQQETLPAVVAMIGPA